MNPKGNYLILIDWTLKYPTRNYEIWKNVI